MKHLLWILIALCLVSCAGPRYTSTTSAKQESDYVNTLRLDSLFRSAMQRDSIYVHDSIYVREKGDTVTKYVEKVRYQYKTLTDTIYRNISQRDTVYIERTDSVVVEKPCYIEKRLKWYESGFLWLGKMCCIAAILWALFLYLKRKF